MTLRLDTFRVSLGGRDIVGPLDASIPPGVAVAIVGKNGAGKTVLLDALSGRFAFTGAALLDGAGATVNLSTDGCGVAERAQHIASLSQRVPDAGAFTVGERIAHGLYSRRDPLRAEEVSRRVVEAAELFDVHAYLPRPLASLSVGQQKRAHLARVFVQSPQMLTLLDEPFAGLDVGQHRRVTENITRRAQAGRGVIFSTHHLARAREADLVMGLNDGALVFGPEAPDSVSPDALLSLFD